MQWNVLRKHLPEGAGYQIFAAIIANLMAVSDGMAVGWTSPMIPYFLSNNTHIAMTRRETEWLETWMLLGSAIGIPFTVILVDTIGRKKSLLLSSLILLLAWVVIAFAPSIEYIYGARAFSGMAGDMAFVAAPIYIAEIADQRIRGLLSTFIFIMMMAGVLIMYAIGSTLPYYTCCVIGIILLSIELVVFSFLPETPYYLLLINRPEEAERSLKKFRGATGFTTEELQDISTAVEIQKNESKLKILDIFTVKNYRKAMLIMIILNSAQQLSSINVILMNMHEILNSAGSTYMETSKAAIIFASLMFIAGGSASITIDKYGRKKLMIVSCVATGLCLFMIAVYFNIKISGGEYHSISWIPIVSVMVYAAAFKFGLGMVPIVITAEIFHTKVKALGMAVADGVYDLSGIVSIQIFNVSKRAFGMHVPFYIFAGCSFATVLFIIFFIPETKGKSLDEIQRILKGDSKKIKTDT